MPNPRSTVSAAGYLKESFHYFHLRDTAGQELDFHFHEFDKLVILISGRVDYLVESSRYTLMPHDVLLVKHHTIHKAEIDKSLPYERIIIYLDGGYFRRLMPSAGLMDCFDTADRRSRHLLSPSTEQYEELMQTVTAYERIAGEELFGSQAMRESYMLQLLVLASRLGEARRDKSEQSARYDGKIAQALSIINEELATALTVDTLAERLYLSRYHFMRLFKAQTGTTVHAYIRQKRLMHAARLIREGMSASKAAMDSGFTDYSAFHRAFRESFGTSPGKLSTHDA